MRRLPFRRLVSLATLAVIGAATMGTTAACGDDDSATGGGDSGPVTLRLGYFPNITHAPAVVGVEKGIFAEKLGNGVKLEPKTFNAGPAAIEAIFSGALDATYIGPNPTMNAFSKSKGEAVRVISGAASGGVALVVKPGSPRPSSCAARRSPPRSSATPRTSPSATGSRRRASRPTKEGGGDVKIVPQENAQTVETFTSGAIDGAWVPEPFVSRLVNAGGKVLVDERDLWPDKKFVITNLIVSTKFLKAHPDAVKKLVEGQVAANDFVNTKPDEAQQAISDHIGKITGKPLDLKLIKQAWPDPAVHQRPHRVLAQDRAGPRRRRRADPAGQPRRPVRPEVPQRGAQDRRVKPRSAQP